MDVVPVLGLGQGVEMQGRLGLMPAWDGGKRGPTGQDTKEKAFQFSSRDLEERLPPSTNKERTKRHMHD